MNPTKKDVIYVDIEDDITSIIDKVKGAKAPIVALVPPKRIGVLQSVVNLKLLQRASESADKRLVLITNDNALSSLAAGVSIPIAKNLQSKPEIPTATALEVDDEEVINGDELPVGELAATAPLATAVATKSNPAPRTSGATPLAMTAAANAPRKGAKLPDFDKFRKKLFLLIAGGILLLGFLIWAIFFAPKATIAITANTNLLNIDQTLQLRPGATLDTAQHILPANVQQTKKTSSVDFDPTGKKDIGTKATGTMKLTRTSVSSTPISVPAGTSFSSGGITFLSTEGTTLDGTTIGPGGIVQDTATVRVEATSIGEEYNVAAQGYESSVSGFSSQGSAMSGGTKQNVTVISGDDIAKAREKLQAQDSNAIKTELKKKFSGEMIVIEESFKAEAAEPVSTPKLDEQASGKAKLTAETTYTLVGIKRSDLKSDFDTYLKKQLAGKDNQKVYASGDEKASFSQFAVVEGGYTVKTSAQAQIGPQIDEAQLKKQLAGKRSGEIQQQLETIDGIEDVQTSFFPFWVTQAPGADKITIKFVLKNDAN